MPSAKTVYLSFGSNVGDRAANIARAVAALDAAGVRVLRRSLLYRTEPVGFRPQRWFLNCAVEAETHLLPLQLLQTLRNVERALGRRRLVRQGPRVIDIDLLLFGSRVIRAADLEVPHPRMSQRRFVLVPLAELASGLFDPCLRYRIAAMLVSSPDRSRAWLWTPAQPAAKERP